MALPHLVARHIVKALLWIRVGIVAMLVGVASTFAPKCAIRVEKFNVCRLICSASPSAGPNAVFLFIARNRNHQHGVAIASCEVGVGRYMGSCHRS